MTGKAFQFASYTLDLERLALTGPSGQVELRPKSFEVLKVLIEHAGRVVSKEEMLKTVWSDVVVTDESLTRCISEVRRAIGDSDQQAIKTVPRRGYLFDLPCRRDASPGGIRPGAGTLPVPPTPLIGRSCEVRSIVRALQRSEARLLTLTGPPGVGKTRLALAAAAVLEEGFQSGVVYVNLAPLRDSGLFEHTLIQLLSLRRFPARPPLERLARHLADRHVVLVLDNFEQVIAARSSVAALIELCPRLHILVTSREALGLAAEREFPVQPLAVPNPDDTSNPAAIARATSVALFVARAKSVHPRFALSRANARTIADICRRLDGLPLAIELAAARVKVLSPEAILTRLSHRLSLLVARVADRPERHQTLRAAIAWSEDLLQPDERTIFRRLAVFSGGFTLDAAQAVAATDVPDDALGAITGLVNKSLVRPEAARAGEPRFGMLETIREYAWEQLTALGEAEATRDRHLAYFVGLAERALALFNSQQAHHWFATMEEEYENFRSALGWAGEKLDSDADLRLASAMCRFWYFRGNVGEGFKWVDAALARRRDASPALRARLLHGAAAMNKWDEERAVALDNESLALARSVGDRETIARCLLNLGVGHLDKDPQRAGALLAESLAVSRGIDVEDKLRVIGQTLHALAVVAQAQGDLVRAARLYGCAEAALEPFGIPYYQYAIADETVLGRSIVAVLRGLGAQAFAAAWTAGRQTPIELMINYTLGCVAFPCPPSPSSGPKAEAGIGPLTHREWEVAQLITQGLTNREIGKALTVSERTVDGHVQHILNKLGFSSRTQVAAWVAVSRSPATNRSAVR
jgi:predicted ATPase/DNA-binding winged helix-turn-helix (wHTH) protein/DNA-binding CsgD family transcriptional regulator